MLGRQERNCPLGSDYCLGEGCTEERRRHHYVLGVLLTRHMDQQISEQQQLTLEAAVKAISEVAGKDDAEAVRILRATLIDGSPAIR